MNKDPKHTTQLSPGVLEVVARPGVVGSEVHHLRALEPADKLVVPHVRHLGALLDRQCHIGNLWVWLEFGWGLVGGGGGWG